MERKGTEIASAEATAVVSNGKQHLVKSRHAALFCINRVKITHIGKTVNFVKLLTGKSRRGRILHKHKLAVALNNALSADMVLLILLFTAGSGIFAFAFANLFKRRTFHRRAGLIFRYGNKVAGTAYIVHFRD